MPSEHPGTDPRYDEACWKLEDLLETVGMPDRTVDFVDSLDKWNRKNGFLSPKQIDKILDMWIQYVRDE
jgi:hypothetical protein